MTAQIKGTKLEQNGRGQVRIWDIPAKRYRWAYPIDVHEMLKAGTCCYHDPSKPKEVEEEEQPPFDFGAYRVDDLKAFAEQAGIEDAVNLRKAELIAKLEELNFRPANPSE